MSNPSLSERVPQRKAGEQFNPCRRDCGFYPPDIIARQRDLGNGPKRLYERLVRWSGDKGTCWYGYKTMAAAIGKCERQVKSYMAALEKYGLIKHQRCGRRLANRYVFLWHPLFDGGEVQSAAPPEPSPQASDDMQPGAHHREKNEVQLPTSDVQPGARGDGQPAAHELCNQNSVQGIASSSSQSQPADAVTGELTDDDPFSKKSPKSPVRECLLEFVRASSIEMPIGRIPVNEIEDGLAGIGANTADLVGFLKDYADRWRDAPASWNHVLVSFRHWTKDPKTYASLRRRFAWQAAAEQQLKTGGESESTVWTQDGDSAPELLPRVQNEVRQRCSECHNGGLLGNAIDQNLRFCSCSSGEEARQRDGANWPEQEIARVHCDTRSLLVAACYALGMSFTGDALTLSEVNDDGSALEIIPTTWHAKIRAIREGDLQKALTCVGWKRSVRVTETTNEVSDAVGSRGTAPESASVGANVRTVDSANCRTCGGRILLFSDGTSQECGCIRKCAG